MHRHSFITTSLHTSAPTKSISSRRADACSAPLVGEASRAAGQGRLLELGSVAPARSCMESSESSADGLKFRAHLGVLKPFASSLPRHAAEAMSVLRMHL